MDKDNSDESNTPTSFSLTPTITSLLQPTASYLGKEIKDQVMIKVKQLKEQKRKKNVNKYMKKAGAKLNIPLSYNEESLENIKQLDLFEEWVDGAQDIDPNEPVLSQLWQSILLDIIRGENTNHSLLYALKQLDTEEAFVLLKFKNKRGYHPKSSKEKYIIRKLLSLELIELDWFFMSLVIASYVLLLAMLYSFPEISQIASFSPYINIEFIALCLAVTLGLSPLFPKYRKSWLGKKLLSYISNEEVDKVMKKRA